MKYVVQKRPNEKAFLVEHKEETVSLEVLQKAVGGFVEVTHIVLGNVRFDLWIDEEGLLKDLEPNFWHFLMGAIVGPVLVCACDAEGDSVPISKKDAEEVARWLDQNSYWS